MLDLTKILSNTVDIKIGERVFKCSPVSHLQFNTMLDKEEELKAGTAAFFDFQKDFVYELLNNNKNGQKLTKDEYGQIPQVAIFQIYQFFVRTAYEIMNDPN